MNAEPDDDLDSTKRLTADDVQSTRFPRVNVRSPLASTMGSVADATDKEEQTETIHHVFVPDDSDMSDGSDRDEQTETFRGTFVPDSTGSTDSSAPGEEDFSDLEETRANRRVVEAARHVVPPPPHQEDGSETEDRAFDSTRSKFPTASLFDPELAEAWRVIRGRTVATESGRRAAEHLVWAYISLEAGRKASALRRLCQAHEKLGPVHEEWPEGLKKLSDRLMHDFCEREES